LRRKGLPQALLLLALSASALQGCAWLSKPLPSPFSRKPPAAAPVAAPVVAPVVKPAVKPPAIAPEDKLFAEGMAALKDGGLERALELFAAAWQEKPGHAGVAREFDGVLLALKKNGDAAYAQGKWEDAGKRWTGTLRFITHPAANSRGYPFTRSEVAGKIDQLSAALTEKALTEYRRGEIQAAIAEWKTILSYDPGHEEAARSLRTASKQLETLKKMPPGK
jgi:tetratricopeptide (TPR) repeat protein